MKVLSNIRTKSIHKKIPGSVSPVLAYNRLYTKERYSFLFESLEPWGERGRYSFIGARPLLIFKTLGSKILVEQGGDTVQLSGNPFEVLKQILGQYRQNFRVQPFGGGAVGYIGYDAIRYLEKIPDKNQSQLNLPEIFLIFPEELIVFDHYLNYVDLIINSGDSGRVRVVSDIFMDCPPMVSSSRNTDTLRFSSNFDEDSFCKVVNKAKLYIKRGDVFQVVLSQRLYAETETDPFYIYQALRKTNPSPYMYYLKFDDCAVLGSSPETLVKLKDGVASSRPIAGTRPRGDTIKEDKALADELLDDEKERAEHTMLVDLARNDLGRVCRPGSVRPTELFRIERFSKVMHIVSDIEGRLNPGCDAVDLFCATFPAGTVTGAPKVRAMEIIDELEPVKREIYAGAIGYFDFWGNMDFCIAIRTIVIHQHKIFIQAGAGVVADSIPEREYLETLNKASALINAVNFR